MAMIKEQFEEWIDNFNMFDPNLSWEESSAIMDAKLKEVQEATGEIYLPCSDISDFHKEAFGHRPRHYPLWMPKADFEAELEYIGRAFDRHQQEEKERQDEAVVKFEAHITNMIDMGAGNRETALRWIRDTQDDFDKQYGDERLEWDFGIPFGYIKKSA